LQEATFPAKTNYSPPNRGITKQEISKGFLLSFTQKSGREHPKQTKVQSVHSQIIFIC
jgi:hypothetical protein